MRYSGPTPRNTFMNEIEENKRLVAVRGIRNMDTSQEAAYDDITRLAASLCDAPIALIALVDDKCNWFISCIGLQATETPRELGFCAEAIKTPGDVFVVPDASADARFARHALVIGDPHIRFYAGVPLVTSDGLALGTLCVIDTKPRELSTHQLRELQFMAQQIIITMERTAALKKSAPALQEP